MPCMVFYSQRFNDTVNRSRQASRRDDISDSFIIAVQLSRKAPPAVGYSFPEKASVRGSSTNALR